MMKKQVTYNAHKHNVLFGHINTMCLWMCWAK